MTVVPHPRDLRASDADRERVAAVLHEAAADGRLTAEEHSERTQRAYDARTLGQLAELTQDLLLPSAQPIRLDDSRAATAFFATTRREGRWVVPARWDVTAVGGHVIADLREAILQSRHTIVAATLIGGQLHLLVPQGVAVRVVPARHPWRAGTQAAPLPAPLPGQQPPPDAPFIDVRAFTVAGRVRVHTPRPPSRWRRRRDPR